MTNEINFDDYCIELTELEHREYFDKTMELYGLERDKRK